jgi:hypothetical protein
MKYTRRSLLASLGGLGIYAAVPPSFAISEDESLNSRTEEPSNCPFRLAVINDEITQDFEKACQVAADDFKLR